MNYKIVIDDENFGEPTDEPITLFVYPDTRGANPLTIGNEQAIIGSDVAVMLRQLADAFDAKVVK